MLKVVAGAKKLAFGSGAAFAVGATAGVVGNNLANGMWFWVVFVVLVLTGGGLSAWLAYRGASGSAPTVRHAGNNSVGRVSGGTAVGVNYGHASGRGAQE